MKVMEEVRYIRTPEEREKIMKACHMDPTSGDMGVKKTIYRITERFFCSEGSNQRCGIYGLYSCMCIELAPSVTISITL